MNGMRNWRNHILEWLIAGIVGCGLLTSCGSPPPENIYNIVSCSTDGAEEQPFVRAETEGQEENLQAFFELMDSTLGKPRMTFLHYTLDTFAEFFRPEGRALQPSVLKSPFGVQKIMVWDSILVSEIHWDTLSLSLQVEEQLRGNRPVDRPFCVIELRLIDLAGHNLLANCDSLPAAGKWLQQMLEAAVGPPHPVTPDPAWDRLSARYDSVRAEYARRVAPYLAPGCYPPVTRRPWAPAAFNLQICEHDSIKDTLFCTLKVLDQNQEPTPFSLLDILAERYTDTLKILDGVSGYRLFLPEGKYPGKITIVLPNGAEILFFGPGDYIDDRYRRQISPAQRPGRTRRKENYSAKRLEMRVQKGLPT